MDITTAIKTTVLKKTTLAMILSVAFIFGAQAATLKVAFDSDPVSMDPMEQISEGTLQMANLIFDPLVRYNEHLKIVPRLATSWEQISPTDTRFHLRKGVKFHSGNEMTADDVIWSFNRFQTSADFKAIFASYTEMKKVDDYTVDLMASKPYPLVLANASYLFVMDSKFYTGKTEDGKDKSTIAKSIGTFASMHTSGTGPFMLGSRQQGVELTYIKNPHYWGHSGNVDKIILKPIKENATRLAALLSGDVDFIAPVAPTDLERVKNAKNKELYTLSSDRIITLQLNEKVVPQFKDKRVREAVVYAINNDAIVKKIMRGFATTAGQNSPDGYLGYNPNLKPRFDLNKAKSLMKEAGYEKGFTVTMIAPNNRYVNDEKVAQAAANMLSKINIKVQLTTMPKAQYWDEFDKATAGIAMIGWASDTGDSANYSEFLTMTRDPKTGKGSYNSGFYSNPKLDELVEATNSDLDIKHRTKTLQEISQIEYNDAAFVPLHWDQLAWGYDKKITNFPSTINLKNFPLFGDLIIKE